MRNWMIPLMAAAAAAMAPANAAAQIAIAVNESLTLRVDDSGKAEVVKRERAQPSAYDQAVIKGFFAGAYDEGVGDKSVPVDSAGPLPPAPPVAPGQIRISFVGIADRNEAVLIVENGYGEALRYHITVKGGSQTYYPDVCMVAPGRRGYERFPVQLDGGTLTGLERVTWSRGDPLPCLK
ncbi:hypothetical protein OF829_05675 [Sphingomonas sp. LB-2]|uniref:hypothetical protein n=1 Tax=Sphingomonas caeni TaxID=2984949 RepID=UPI002230F75B|nr:hypothetical protein [Sphingomonas caeni]MCW3846720.1 hypothetical protein [Sphingomonas caeni]